MAKIFAKIADTDLLHDTAHLSDSAFRALIMLCAWGAYWRTGASMDLSMVRKLLRSNRRKQNRIIAELTLSDGCKPCAFIVGSGADAQLQINPEVVPWGRAGGPSPKTVEKLIARDGSQCRYCGCDVDGRSLHVDHVVPVSLGGSDLNDNLVIACRSCNCKKNDKTPEQARMELH